MPERRRGAVLEAAILAAAVAELDAVGYPAFTMDAVARRAGTNKNAIYRRWPTRAALAAAAHRSLVRERLRPPSTGSLRGDALALLRQINADMATPRGELLRAMAADPEVVAHLRAAVPDGPSTWAAVVAEAVARGEARPVSDRVALLPLTLLRDEYVRSGLAAVPDEVVVEIVDDVYLPLVAADGRG